MITKRTFPVSDQDDLVFIKNTVDETGSGFDLERRSDFAGHVGFVTITGDLAVVMLLADELFPE